jgi:uroporphyrinogen-III synthase
MISSARIVLTRQQESNQAWADQLASAGRPVLELPLLRFEPLPAPDGFSPDAYEWILFTSPQGVRAFAAAGFSPGQARIATLGAGTRAVLAEHGWNDDLGADCLDGTELAATFSDQIQPPGRVLLPGPERRMADPRQSLETAGFSVTELPLYSTRPLEPGSLPVAPFATGDIVFFCSPSTVRAFISTWDERLPCVAIGETTAAVTREHGFPTQVAATPDLNAMIRAAGLDPLSGLNQPESES